MFPEQQPPDPSWVEWTIVALMLLTVVVLAMVLRVGC